MPQQKLVPLRRATDRDAAANVTVYRTCTTTRPKTCTTNLSACFGKRRRCSMAQKQTPRSACSFSIRLRLRQRRALRDGGRRTPLRKRRRAGVPAASIAARVDSGSPIDSIPSLLPRFPFESSDTETAARRNRRPRRGAPTCLVFRRYASRRRSGFLRFDSPRQRSGEQVVEMTVWNDVRATRGSRRSAARYSTAAIKYSVSESTTMIRASP